jgi:hypothetical protein
MALLLWSGRVLLHKWQEMGYFGPHIRRPVKKEWQMMLAEPETKVGSSLYPGNVTSNDPVL